MDFYQLISQKDLSSQVANFINTSGPDNVKVTLLYFYSTVAQSMAALFTVSGFFAIYRLQAIDAQLSRSYASYREWINIRLTSFNIAQINRNHVQAPLAKQATEILGLGSDIEPHSWLEKDIIAHAKSLFEAAQKSGSGLMKALRDYYRHFCKQERSRLLIKIFSIIPLVIIGFLLLDALTQISYLHLQNDFNKAFYIGNVISILKWTKWLLIYLFIYTLFAIFGIPEKNDNNPITNRFLGAPTFLKSILKKLGL